MRTVIQLFHIAFHAALYCTVGWGRAFGFAIYAHLRILHVLCAVVVCISITTTLRGQTNIGRRFWFTFPENKAEARPTSQFLEVLLLAPSGASGTIKQHLGTWQMGFTIAAGGQSRIQVPLDVGYMRGTYSVDKKGLVIEADAPVAAYALNHLYNSTDVATLYPTEMLGNEYYILTHNETSIPQHPSFFAIVATEDDTRLEIRLSAASGPPNSYPAGTVLTPTLQAGEALQIQSAGKEDFTGTAIRVTNTDCKNIAVFAGNAWTQLGGCLFGSHIFEQLQPTRAWGKTYCALPLRGRADYMLKVQASQNQTTIRVNGGAPRVINAGQAIQSVYDSPAFVEADAPVQVMQYSRGARCDNRDTAGVFMTLLPPLEQIRALNACKIPATNFDAGNASWYNRRTVTVLTTNPNAFLVDGAPAGVRFTPVPANTAYFWAHIVVEGSNPLLSCESGFTAHVYGYDDWDGIGFTPLTTAALLPRSAKIVANNLTANQTCVGYSVAFSLEGARTGAYLNWDFGDGNFTQTPEPQHAYAQTGDFTVELRYFDTEFCIDTTLKFLIAVRNPVFTIDAVQNPDCALGQKGAFTVDYTNLTPPVVVRVNGAVRTGSTGTRLRVVNLDAGNYTVELTDGMGCKANQTIELADGAGLGVTAITTNPTCAGMNNGSITASVTTQATGLTFALNNGSYGNNATYTNLKAGTYTVKVRNAIGCEAQTTVTLTDPPKLRLSHSVTPIQCSSTIAGSVSLSVTGGKQPYTYMLKDTTGRTISTNATGIFTQLAPATYRITAQDSAGCSDSLITFTLSVQPPLQWADTIVQYPGCTNPVGSISVGVQGGTPPYRYHWSHNNNLNAATASMLSPGSYSVSVTDAQGCTVAPVVFTLPTFNFVTAYPPDTVFCLPSATAIVPNFTLRGEPAGGLWYGSVAVDKHTGTFRHALAPGLGTHTVVYDAGGCTDTVTIHITTTQLPEALTVCANAEAFPLPTPNAEALGGVWSNGGAALDLRAGVWWFDPKKANANIMRLRYTSPQGCTAQLQLKLKTAPIADFVFWTEMERLRLPNADLRVDDRSINAAHYQWFFGDGATDYRPNPEHRYKRGGIYTVMLVVLSNDGCTDTLKRSITVMTDAHLDIPDAFSPNADPMGINNTWRVATGELRSHSLLLFNRWGQVIYTESQNGVDINWNGRTQDGHICPEGVYIYVIEAITYGGEPLYRNGTVTLIR